MAGASLSWYPSFSPSVSKFLQKLLQNTYLTYTLFLCNDSSPRPCSHGLCKVARPFQKSGILGCDRFELCNDSERLDYEVAQGHDVGFLVVVRESCVAVDICNDSWYEG